MAMDAADAWKPSLIGDQYTDAENLQKNTKLVLDD